jgi:cell wall-associated NlpC family hydrolase
MEKPMSARDTFLAAARSYIGTPYHHMGRAPGVGLDCAGVPLCAARAAGLLPDDFDLPAYSRWPDGTLLAWCDLHMERIERHQMAAGDVLALEVDKGAQHIGVLGNHRFGGLSLIHAAGRVDGSGRVIETRLAFARNQRFVAAFRLRGID